MGIYLGTQWVGLYNIIGLYLGADGMREMLKVIRGHAGVNQWILTV